MNFLQFAIPIWILRCSSTSSLHGKGLRRKGSKSKDLCRQLKQHPNHQRITIWFNKFPDVVLRVNQFVDVNDTIICICLSINQGLTRGEIRETFAKPQRVGVRCLELSPKNPSTCAFPILSPMDWISDYFSPCHRVANWKIGKLA